jgi:general secretion pathway protein B
MSYILDALKKAQADESPDGRAALVFERKERRRQRRWQLLLFAALLLNAVVLVYLFAPSPEGQAPANSISAAPDQELPGGSAAAQLAATGPETKPTAPPAASTPAPRAALTPDLGTTRPASGPAPQRAPDRGAAAAPAPALQTISLAALPAAARARFPALSFSTHLYASDADLRAVVMNGQRLTEGERYGDLELEEITETGVVLRFERYRVTVPVLDDWQ